MHRRIAGRNCIVQQVHMLRFQFLADDCIADVNVCCAEWIFPALFLPFAH